jgi:hypothetical protein
MSHSPLSPLHPLTPHSSSDSDNTISHNHQQKSHIQTPLNLHPSALTSPTSAVSFVSLPKSLSPGFEGIFQLLVLYHQRRNRAPAEEPESVVARL